MKKVQLLTAAAVLFAGTAYGQVFIAPPCVDCTPITVSPTAPAAPDRTSFGGLSPLATSFLFNDNTSHVLQEGDGNRVQVDQVGTKNRAFLQQQEGNLNYSKQDQNGTLNYAGTQIYGTGNTTFQEQDGTLNQASINIDEVVGLASPPAVNNGDNNWAQQRQDGGGNRAAIDQFGNDNFASQDQDGDLNQAKILQKSYDNIASQSQDGFGNRARTNQGNNTVGTGSSDFQRSSIVQTGNLNSALVNQDYQP